MTDARSAAIAVLLMATSSCESVRQEGDIGSDGRAGIAIGAAGPMTGRYAIFGRQMQKGAEQAVKDINAAGGVLRKQLSLRIGNDVCDSGRAVEVANQMADEDVVFVAGHFCSGSSISASEVYNEERILLISPASTNPMLTEQGFDNVFRIFGRDDQQGSVAADYVIDNGLGSTIAILHDTSGYGKGLADEFKNQLNERGVSEAMYGRIIAGDKDFTTLITKMKEAGIDLVYFGGYHAEAALIMRHAREHGLEAQMVSGDALVTDEYWAMTGDAGQDTLMTFSVDPRRIEGAAPVVAEFIAQGDNPEGYTLYTYAAIQVWAQAVEKAGTTDLDKVIEVLRHEKSDTVLGVKSFDEKGDVHPSGYVMYEWSNGQYRAR